MDDLIQVLIVDDNEINRSVLTDLTQALGHQAILAENGQRAFEVLENQKVDIMLLDILMPVMDGYQVLERLNEKPAYQDIPVIVISAVDDLSSVVRCIELGADDYLVKPFNTTLLKTRIKSSLEKKLVQDEQRRLHYELDASYQALQEAEQARDALMHMVVHDVNNSVGVLSGYLDLIDEDIPDEQQSLHSYINKCTESVEDIRGLIQTLLDVAKLESGELSPSIETVQLNKLVRRIINNYIEVTPDRDIQLNPLPKEMEVDTDIGLVVRVLQNLLSNAVRYSKQKIEVTISHEDDADTVRLIVKDDGEGLAPELHEKVFEKYAQVSGSKSGEGSVGLGLAFCKLATRALSGNIWVESEPGQGANFIVALPIRPPVH